MRMSQSAITTIAGAKLISIKNAGHLMNMDKPEEFNTAITGFIDGMKSQQNKNQFRYKKRESRLFCRRKYLLQETTCSSKL